MPLGPSSSSSHSFAFASRSAILQGVSAALSTFADRRSRSRRFCDNRFRLAALILYSWYHCSRESQLEVPEKGSCLTDIVKEDVQRWELPLPLLRGVCDLQVAVDDDREEEVLSQ